MNKERKQRSIGWYILFGWIFFLYVFACYHALQVRNQTASTQIDASVPQDVRSRIRKHGLDKQFSVIEINGDKFYFYRDGKRCQL